MTVNAAPHFAGTLLVYGRAPQNANFLQNLATEPGPHRLIHSTLSMYEKFSDDIVDGFADGSALDVFSGEDNVWLNKTQQLAESHGLETRFFEETYPLDEPGEFRESIPPGLFREPVFNRALKALIESIFPPQGGESLLF